MFQRHIGPFSDLIARLALLLQAKFTGHFCQPTGVFTRRVGLHVCGQVTAGQAGGAIIEMALVLCGGGHFLEMLLRRRDKHY
jgi:hypothetical protein